MSALVLDFDYTITAKGIDEDKPYEITDAMGGAKRMHAFVDFINRLNNDIDIYIVSTNYESVISKFLSEIPGFNSSRIKTIKGEVRSERKHIHVNLLVHDYNIVVFADDTKTSFQNLNPKVQIMHVLNGSGLSEEDFSDLEKMLSGDAVFEPVDPEEFVYDTPPPKTRAPHSKVVNFRVECRMECEVCGSRQNLHACSNCHAAVYCGRKCQAKDWNTHKCL